MEIAHQWHSQGIRGIHCEEWSRSPMAMDHKSVSSRLITCTPFTRVDERAIEKAIDRLKRGPLVSIGFHWKPFVRMDPRKIESSEE